MRQKKRKLESAIEIANYDLEEYNRRAQEMFQIKFICTHKGNKTLITIIFYIPILKNLLLCKH